MLGQDAALIAKNFNDALELTGVIMSRVDGDARGGAALSMRIISGKPIKFIGTGEKVNEFEVFHPDRVASSILGFGDVVGLVEKAKEVIDEKEAQKAMERMQKGIFDFNDMYRQLKGLNSLGGVGKIASMMPGMGNVMSKLNVEAVGDEVKTQMVIIQSMSKMERKLPHIINPSRINRISRGAGVSVSEVRKLIKKYEQFCKMMKQFSKFSPADLERMQRMMNIGK
jgi:signal recognition particle subunit SRP54